jgi:hypothetical protein
MVSSALETFTSCTRFLYESALKGLHRAGRYGKPARRITALCLLLAFSFWLARETYYIHTDPRIEPGSNVVAVAPLDARAVSKFDFSIEVLGINPQFANSPIKDGFWARLRPDYDRNATTQANAVTFQAQGPGPSCRAYTLALGQTGVHAAGDARITFLGMYSGLIRFDVSRLSREVTVDSDGSVAIPGTRVAVSVEPASEMVSPDDPEAPGRTFTVSCRGCREQAPVKQTVLMDSIATLDGTELQVARVSPANVTFRVRNIADSKEQQTGLECANGM